MISWIGRHFPRSALTIFALLHVEQSLVALLDQRQRPVANVRTQFGHALSTRLGPVFEQTVCRRNARRNSMESTGGDRRYLSRSRSPARMLHVEQSVSCSKSHGS